MCIIRGFMPAESLRVHIYKNKKTRLSSRQTSEHGARAGIKRALLGVLFCFLLPRGKNEETVLFPKSSVKTKRPDLVLGKRATAYEGIPSEFNDEISRGFLVFTL